MMNYKEEHGQLIADDGTEFAVVVQHVDIDPELAKQVFSMGVETGRWHWKEKFWYCPTAESLETIQAAARFYYGWSEGSESISKAPCGGFVYQASYAC